MGIPLGCFLSLTLVSSAVAQASLGYLDVGIADVGHACCMAVDSSGNIFVAGSSTSWDPTKPGSAISGIVVAKFDPGLKPVFRFVFGGRCCEVLAIAVDGQGNVFVAGQTGPFGFGEFPLVHPLVNTPAEPNTGFVSKINAAGNQLVFSTTLGGAIPNSATVVNAMAVDAKGDVYLTGTTSAGDFPVMPGAYQRSGPAVTANGTPDYAFITKLTNSGDRILYSTFLGDGAGPCPTGGSCTGVGHTAGKAIAVAPDGAITITGFTTAPKYPVTRGALQTDCRCNGSKGSSGFVTRLTPDGAALQWSTFLGGGGNPSLNGIFGDQLWRLALTPDGETVVAGFTVSPDFPVTPGAFQSGLVGVENAVIARINSSGTRLVFSTYFGSSASVDVLQLDAEGHPWVTGFDPALDFAVLPGSLRLGTDFLSELSSDGTKLLQSQRLPRNTTNTGLALDPSGGQTLFGLAGSILRLPPGGTPSVIVTGLTNAAGFGSAKVAPGEIVSFYGAGLGPAGGVGAQFDSAGKISTQLAGTQVLFDGIPAPLLYVGAGQINAIVPFGVGSTPSTFVEVRTAGGIQANVSAEFVPADPRIFSDGVGNALALNQNGTLNSSSNPANQGSIITFWASGSGLLPSLTDGSIVQPPLPVPLLPVSVIFDSTETGEVAYAGAAPGLVAGILQVNVRIPIVKNGVST